MKPFPVLPPMKKTVRETVYQELKQAIFSGSIDADHWLTELSLSESLQISRTPIREALSDLYKDGLLVHVPQKGYRVRTIKAEELEQIVFLRSAIECEGVRRIAGSLTEEHLRMLVDILNRQQQSVEQNDPVLFVKLDQEFHTQLLVMTGQNILRDAMQSMYDLARLVSYSALMNQGRMREALTEHRRIVDALARREQALAVDSMQMHLDRTYKNAKQHINP